MKLPKEVVREIDEVLDSLEDAAAHPWVQDRPHNWQKAVCLTDWDRDNIGMIEADTLVRVIPALRAAMSTVEWTDVESE